MTSPMLSSRAQFDRIPGPLSEVSAHLDRSMNESELPEFSFLINIE
jgi:hypothetical protein